jgi:hypothetical protein
VRRPYLNPGPSSCLHSNALTTRLWPTYFLPFTCVSDSGFSCGASYMCTVLRTLPAPWAPPPVPSLQRHCRPLAHAWPWPSASGPRRLRVRGSVRAELRTSPEVKRREIGLLLRWKKQSSVPARCGASALRYRDALLRTSVRGSAPSLAPRPVHCTYVRSSVEWASLSVL